MAIGVLFGKYAENDNKRSPFWFNSHTSYQIISFSSLEPSHNFLFVTTICKTRKLCKIPINWNKWGMFSTPDLAKRKNSEVIFSPARFYSALPIETTRHFEGDLTEFKPANCCFVPALSHPVCYGVTICYARLR